MDPPSDPWIAPSDPSEMYCSVSNPLLDPHFVPDMSFIEEEDA